MKKIGIFNGIFLIVPIVIFGILFINNSNLRQQGSGNSNHLVENFLSQFSFHHGTAKDLDSGWKLYSNKAMGAEFPYPDFFALESDTASQATFKVNYRPKGQNFDFYLYLKKGWSVNSDNIPKCTHQNGEDPNTCLNDFSEGPIQGGIARTFVYRGDSYIQVRDPKFEFKAAEGLGRFSLGRMYSEFRFL